MPELLILNDVHSKSQDIENLAESKGFRVKTCSTIDDALKWIAMRELQALLIPMTTEVSVQQELADALWKKKSNRFVCSLYLR